MERQRQTGCGQVSQKSNPVCAAQFGLAAVGANYWIDDVVICRADDGDWDGNLLPMGDYETVEPLLKAGEPFRVEIPDESKAVFGIDETNPISGNKSFYMEKKDAGGFWDFIYFSSFRVNEDVKTEISFKAKSNMEGSVSTIIRSRWDADLEQQHVVTITPEVNTYTLNADASTVTGGSLSSNGYYFGGFEGVIVTYSSLELAPVGFKLWLDDVKITEEGTGTAIENVAQEAVYLYPTVARSGETIAVKGLNANGSVEIYNTLGNRLIKSASKNIETSRLNPGIYVAKINTGRSIVSVKFSVK